MQSKTTSIAGGLGAFFMTGALLVWLHQIKAGRQQLSDNLISI